MSLFLYLIFTLFRISYRSLSYLNKKILYFTIILWISLLQHLDNVDDADMNEADNEDHSESEQELDSESDHDSEDDEEKNEDSKNDEGEEGELEFEEENGEAYDSNAKQQRFISIVF